MSTPTTPAAEAVVVAPATETNSVEAQVRQLAGNAKSLTMYAAANIMSVVLKRRVREQMLYNYRAKRLIPVNHEGRVTVDDLVAFIQKRADKKA